MPPEERFVPRFAAEPPLEELPYGRWAERLSGEFLAACLDLDTVEEDLGEPGEIRWYPDRTWHGRTYVPGTTITANGYELFGSVRFVPGGAIITAELADLAVDQCELVEERFTLIAPDDYRHDLLEIKLFGANGRELARESLYAGEDEEDEVEDEAEATLEG